MNARSIIAALAFALLAGGPPGIAAELDGIRGSTPLTREPRAPALPREVTDDKRQARNYPEQPPIIPHSIRDYRIDLNSNKCLSCHARSRTSESQAPMISITHFMDRDDQMLASVTPRRYFCTQCHVQQTVVSPPVPNTFKDIDEILAEMRAKAAPARQRRQ
jgi:cytochrome c-type protein NapB